MALRISFGVGIKDATTWLHVRHSSRMQFLYRHASVCTSVHHNAPTNHWRTHSHQRTNHRAFAHLARSRDCHMIRPISQRTPSTNNFTHLGSLMQCRGLSIDVKGGGDPMVYLPTPTECSYELLEYLHDQFVLPWWLTIAVTTFVLRGVFVLPFSIWQQRVLARIDIVQPEINTHAEHIKQQVALLAKEKSWSQKEMADIYSQEVKRVVQMLHYHYKCHSRQIFYVGIVQMGVWTSLTMAVGQMTGKYPELFSADAYDGICLSRAHVGPQCMPEWIRITKSGGMIMFVVRDDTLLRGKEFCDGAVDTMLHSKAETGGWQLLEKKMVAYLDGDVIKEKAHIYVLKV